MESGGGENLRQDRGEVSSPLEQIHEATEIIRQAGLKPVLAAGSLSFRGRAVNGIIEGDTVHIRTDATYRDGTRINPANIARHEVFHNTAAYDSGIINTAIEIVRKTKSENEFETARDIYYTAYRELYDFENMTEEEIEAVLMEEIAADAYAGMNFFRADAEMALQLQSALPQVGENHTADQTNNGSRASPRASYAGQNARTANSTTLQQAEQMEREGRSNEEIRQETGWFRGSDGQWRFEIDDSGVRYYRNGDAQFRKDHPEYARYQELTGKMLDGTINDAEFAELRELAPTWGNEERRLQEMVNRGGARLDMLLDHPALFDAYPELRSASVRFAELDAGERGSYDPRTNTITLSNELRAGAEDTLIHEIQHAIQNAEGFAGGASVEYWMNQGYSEEEAREMYRRTGGEAEARDAASRRTLTAEERKNTPPDLGDENTVFAGDTQRALMAIGLTTSNRPFVEITDDILAGIPQKDWRKTVKDNLKSKFPSGITIGNSNIVIDKQSRKEMTFSRYSQWLAGYDPQMFADKMRATNNADEILAATRDWINEGPLHPRTDNIIDFARGKTLLRVGGNDYIADVIVATESSGTMKLYDFINLTPTSFVAKETDTAITHNPSPGGSRNTVSISNNSIRSSAKKSNPQNGKASVEVRGRSLQELRRELAAAEEEYAQANQRNDTEYDFEGQAQRIRELTDAVERAENGEDSSPAAQNDNVGEDSSPAAQNDSVGEAGAADPHPERGELDRRGVRICKDTEALEAEQQAIGDAGLYRHERTYRGDSGTETRPGTDRPRGGLTNTDYLAESASWMLLAPSLPAPMARMTVAAPVTASPPA